MFLHYQLARPDDWLKLNQRLFNRGPDVHYYLEKRMLEEAGPVIEAYGESPDDPRERRDKAILLALQGKHREAQWRKFQATRHIITTPITALASMRSVVKARKP